MPNIGTSFVLILNSMCTRYYCKHCLFFQFIVSRDEKEIGGGSGSGEACGYNGGSSGGGGEGCRLNESGLHKCLYRAVIGTYVYTQPYVYLYMISPSRMGTIFASRVGGSPVPSYFKTWKHHCDHHDHHFHVNVRVREHVHVVAARKTLLRGWFYKILSGIEGSLSGAGCSFYTLTYIKAGGMTMVMKNAV